jgi:hypothetical protein
VKVRRVPRESGTCHADLCDGLVWPDPREGFEDSVRAFCETHSRERDLEIEARNVAGGTADVLRFNEWERDADGRARRKES